jgi:Cu-Zn family superoxide dismutase
MQAAAVAVFSKHGHVEFLETKKSKIEVKLELCGFKKHATHAIHIHEFGDTREGCASLGGHYNPSSKTHGQHAGDLVMNFTTDGRGRYRHRYHDVHLDSIQDLFGRSVVIHEGIDDHGLGGREIDGRFVHYRDMPDALLRTMVKGQKTRAERIEMLENESTKNGNAGGRMDCAIIGRQKLLL